MKINFPTEKEILKQRNKIWLNHLKIIQDSVYSK